MLPYYVNCVDKYLNMELDEKRKLYKCGDEYLTLPNILTWAEYFVKERVQPAGDGNDIIRDTYVSTIILMQEADYMGIIFNRHGRAEVRDE